MIILDASALLTLVNKEAGWDFVARQAVNQDATISAVNYAEVLQKAGRLGVAAEDIDAQMDALGITVSPFSRLDARLAASFYRHRSGLSLADPVCLALARSVASPAYTADRLWSSWADELGGDVSSFDRTPARPNGGPGGDQIPGP